MRRASHLALAALLAFTVSPLATAGADAGQAAAPRFPTLPEDTAKAQGPLDVTDRYLVTLRDGKDVDKAEGKAKRLGVVADKTFKHALKGYSAKLNPHQLAELRSDPDVEDVVPDEIFTMQSQTRPTGVRRVFAQDNAISRINGIDGDITNGERVDADVAIVDTGIDKNHPDLNVAGGVSCSTANPQAWGDGNGHGTHVAGIVGAIDNSFGVVGVAPGVRLWAVRILDSAGNGLLSWYVCGLDWIAAQRDPIDPTRPLFESVNMSVAKTGKDDGNCGFTNKDVIHKAICRLVASGVTVVAAAGNNSFNAANLKPASYDEVITVSALADSDGKPGGVGGSGCYSWGGYDRDDTFADFSNYGRDVDLIAPGKCILSTLPGNRYGSISGTSMAAPLVTGAAALYKASRPLATPAQVRLALRAAGTLDWNTASDPDSVHEPLLDVSHVLALGDWTLDATPGTSDGTLLSGAGGAVTAPVQVIRAEDLGTDITLSIDAGAPFAASIEPDTLTSQDGDSASLSITVPASTPSGTYQVKVRASDGTRERTSEYPVVVDSIAPVNGAPTMRLRAGNGADRSERRRPSLVARRVGRRERCPRLPVPVAGRRDAGRHDPRGLDDARREPLAGHGASVRPARPRPGPGRELERLEGERGLLAVLLAGHEPHAPSLPRLGLVPAAGAVRRQLALQHPSRRVAHPHLHGARRRPGRHEGAAARKGPGVDRRVARRDDRHPPVEEPVPRPRLHRALGHVRATHAPRRRGRDGPPAARGGRRLRDRPVGVTSARVRPTRRACRAVVG